MNQKIKDWLKRKEEIKDTVFAKKEGENKIINEAFLRLMREIESLLLSEFGKILNSSHVSSSNTSSMYDNFNLSGEDVFLNSVNPDLATIDPRF